MDLGVPEKCLILFLGIPYKTVGQCILPMALEDSSLETTRNLALQLASAFQASGHEMFSVFTTQHVPDASEAVEVLPAAAVVLSFMSCCMTQNAKTAFLLP